MYSLRTRKSLEYWLVDIGYWTANVDDRTSFYENIRHDLRNLHLDLDDDLYFFEGKTTPGPRIMPFLGLGKSRIK